MTSSVLYLSYIQQVFTRYADFCQSQQRKNSCSLYLLFMAMCNLICLDVGIIPILYSLDHIDIYGQFVIAYQIQFYIRHALFQMMRT
ncbi:unnamed protein product, partial [Rotaria sp. Silwood1]